MSASHVIQLFTLAPLVKDANSGRSERGIVVLKGEKHISVRDVSDTLCMLGYIHMAITYAMIIPNRISTVIKQCVLDNKIKFYKTQSLVQVFWKFLVNSSLEDSGMRVISWFPLSF